MRVAVESVETFALVGRWGSRSSSGTRCRSRSPQLQDLLQQYQRAREAAGFSGPNDVILQISGYVAETAARARSEPEASTMRRLQQIQRTLKKAADQEAFERLSRLSAVSYDEVLKRVAYGTPEAVVERLQQYQEELGLTGVSLEMNPGGQIPYERVVNAIRLLADRVIPKFK